MQGYATSQIDARTRYIALHYSADEGKRGDWAAQTAIGIPQDEWEREMELREDIWDGEPIFKDYRDAVHCPAELRQGPRLKIASLLARQAPGSTFYGGWDAGQTLQPAFVLVQVTPRPFQVRALLEVVSEGGESMETFAPRVLQTLIDWHPGLWADVNHYGDSTVTTRSGSRGESAQSVAKQKGVHIHPMSNVWASRYAAVTWLLTTMIEEGMPKFYVNGADCPVLRQGFQGAYKYEIAASGDSRGPGMVLRQPLKNAFSHIQDAMQYVAEAIYSDFTKKEATVRSRR